MENKTAAILVLAMLAAVIVTASGAYAMGRQTAVQGYADPSTPFRSGMGPWGGSFGHQEGMMEGIGMVGNSGDQYPMQQHMSHYWNSAYSS